MRSIPKITVDLKNQHTKYFSVILENILFERFKLFNGVMNNFILLFDFTKIIIN